MMKIEKEKIGTVKGERKNREKRKVKLSCQNSIE